MNVVIETGRLLLRAFTIGDAQLIYDLNNDPEVIRYTYDPVIVPGHTGRVPGNTILPQYILYSHSRRTVHTKPGLEFIGWCGLKCRPERKEVDPGYRFKRSVRGKEDTTGAA